LHFSSKYSNIGKVFYLDQEQGESENGQYDFNAAGQYRRQHPYDRSVPGVLHRTYVFPYDPSAEEAAEEAG
jgi:hypothetical protein